MMASLSATIPERMGIASTAHHGWLGFPIGGHPLRQATS